MTTTRRLINNLTYVEPTKSLLLCSMPCEKQTAEIRNKTVNSMNKEDIGGVAYRYLQSRRGERTTFNEIIFSGIMITLIFTFFSYLLKNSKDIFPDDGSNDFNVTSTCLISFILIIMANIPPNISNTLRYGEIKNACDEWLKTKLNSDTYEEIRHLSNNRESLFTLNKILTEENIDTTVLERRGFSLCKK